MFKCVYQFSPQFNFRSVYLPVPDHDGVGRHASCASGACRRPKVPAGIVRSLEPDPPLARRYRGRVDGHRSRRRVLLQHDHRMVYLLLDQLILGEVLHVCQVVILNLKTVTMINKYFNISHASNIKEVNTPR